MKNFYIEIYTQYPSTMRKNETTILKIFHNSFDCCGTGEETGFSVLHTCPEDQKIQLSSCPNKIEDMFSSYAPLMLAGFLVLSGIMTVAVVCSVVLSRHLSRFPEPPPEYAIVWEERNKKCLTDLLLGCFSKCK
ncbi:tetraspanin-2-like [Puntigrus tetrazona]|nr:tetraspanin-2-like [Puntigrus tetrazona]